ncbi:hypothetical protein LJB98_06260, partial [Bacteroidales bacterium OttesenSCG-928-M11]|nr:hypothetical protein [Bacteroidales bacterium OttesenSCG-928-M11]
MKKILFILVAIVLLQGCVTSGYRTYDIKDLRVGMTRYEVENLIGPAERVLSIRWTNLGYEEILQYRNYYNQLFALEYIEGILVGADYIYDGGWYPMYNTRPDYGRPVFPSHYSPNRPAPAPPAHITPSRPSHSNNNLKPANPRNPTNNQTNSSNQSTSRPAQNSNSSRQQNTQQNSNSNSGSSRQQNSQQNSNSGSGSSRQST